MRRLAREAALLGLAAGFLTRLPLPPLRWSPARQSAALRHFPLIGVLIGAAAALVWWGAAALWGPVLGAIAATAATLWLTGALHEDGLADVCDALGGSAGRERALEIMKDSRLGTYGASGLGLALATKVAALVAAGPAAPWLLLAGHGASRASAVLMAATMPYLRRDGTGRTVAATGQRARIGAYGLAWTLATGLGAAALVAVAEPAAAAAGLAGLVLGHVMVRQLVQKRLGGWTGDCLGAVQQASELGLYLGALAWLSS